LDTVQGEVKLQRLLIVFIATGLFFMLIPGTLMGVWNLVSISSRHDLESLSAARLQAHGHAQIFGWIGTFILGIGFYSLSKNGAPAEVSTRTRMVVLRAARRWRGAALDRRLYRVGMALHTSVFGGA
jgi:hypothetical protein